MVMTRPTLLGITDEVTTCELCGKTPLKHTYALDIDGETVYYGSTCGARALREGYGNDHHAPTLDDAKYLQKLIDLLTTKGIEKAKDWALVRGYGCTIKRIGPEGMKRWKVWVSYSDPLLVFIVHGQVKVRKFNF